MTQKTKYETYMTLICMQLEGWSFYLYDDISQSLGSRGIPRPL
jgi:hypothetical protein